MGFQQVVLSERYVINIPLSRSFCLLSACLCKARYTLATKSNSTRSTLLPVCSATTWIFMSHVMTQSLVTAFRYEDVVLASVSTIIAVAAARKRRRRNRSCLVRDFNFDSTVFISIHEVSTLLPIRLTLSPYGAKATRSRLSTKSTVLNSTFLPVCTGL